MRSQSIVLAAVLAGLGAIPSLPAAGQDRDEQALKTASGPQERAEISLRQARILAAEPDTPDRPDRKAEVEQLYRAAIQEASGRLRMDASNSYGVFLLQQGDAGQAASVLSAVESVSSGEVGSPGELESPEDLEPETHSRFLYNYGAALERSGQVEKASAVYLQSFELDPGFMPACDAVFRTAGADFQRRAQVVERLLEEGNLDGARNYLLTGYPSGPSDPDLLVLWVRYLTAAKIGPDQDFRRVLSPGLGRAWWQDDMISRARFGLIEKSYAGDLPLVLDPQEGALYASFWRGSKSSVQAFSDLLRMLGDGFLRAGQPRKALDSYALAWSSAENMDAAVDLASLLLTSKDKVDPQGQVIDQLVSILFQGKGAAYLGGDWPAILRFHTVLGTIFERQARWGSSDDPRSAIFQWEHALQSLQRLEGTAGAPAQNLAPGLHAHLGTAYMEVGRKGDALTQFLLAGEQYVKLGWTETAAAPLRQAEKLAPAAKRPGEKERLRALKTTVAEYVQKNKAVVLRVAPPQ